MSNSLSGSLPALHGAEVLQAEVVLAVHRDSPVGRQAELGSAVGGGRGLRLLVGFFLGFLHLVLQAILDLENAKGNIFFGKIKEVYDQIVFSNKIHGWTLW